MKKIKKFFLIIVSSLFIIYIINVFYVLFHAIHALNNLKNGPDVNNSEIVLYQPNNGIDDDFYVYEKESLIPAFIPQDLIIIKRKGDSVQIWYGGRLSKFEKWFQITLDGAYEEKECNPSTEIISHIEHELSKNGFFKLN